MPDHSIRSLTDDEVLKLLEDRVEDKPEFAAKLADAIAERLAPKLDEKFGFQQGWMTDKLEELSGKIDGMARDNTTRFDTIEDGIRDLRARHELQDGEFRKVNDRLESIDSHLGINTNTRRTG